MPAAVPAPTLSITGGCRQPVSAGGAAAGHPSILEDTLDAHDSGNSVPCGGSRRRQCGRAVTPVPSESQPAQLSPDGRWRWNGTQWVLAQASPPSPSPVWSPPPGPPPSPAGTAPTRPVPTGLAHQFSGYAAWSIGFGAASVLVPIVTPVYFPILPIFGLWRGVLAIRSGRTTGGVIGVVLNVFGCLASLLASGLLFR